jgi:hypothetical protein
MSEERAGGSASHFSSIEKLPGLVVQRSGDDDSG